MVSEDWNWTGEGQMDHLVSSKQLKEKLFVETEQNFVFVSSLYLHMCVCDRVHQASGSGSLADGGVLLGCVVLFFVVLRGQRVALSRIGEDSGVKPKATQWQRSEDSSAT